MPTLGTRVKTTRKKMDLRQKDIGRRADISVPFVSDIENDKRNVSSEVLMRLSDALGVSMHWLMTGETWNGEVPEEKTTIPPTLEAVAAKDGWTFSEAIDLLKMVEYLHRNGTKFKSPDEVEADDWRQVYSVFSRLQA